MSTLLMVMAIVFLDQASKYWVIGSLSLGESREILPGFFNLTHIRNTGAAWGLFSGWNGYLALFSIFMLAALMIFRRSFLVDTREHRLALGFMVAGIIGNLFDRLRFGWVVDFLDFHLAGRHWPSFNVADAAICIGAGLYILSSFWVEEHALRDRRGTVSGSASGGRGA